MIYLFEDRKDRMFSFFQGDLNKYPINLSQVIDSNEKDLPDFFSKLKPFDAVFIHKSYIFSNKGTTIEHLRSIVKNDLDKYFVLFSGGTDNAIVDNKEAIMNSGTFYNNLILFLDNYKEENKIKLPLLVYGPNKYIKNQLRQFQNSVFTKLFLMDERSSYEKILKKVLNDLETILVAEEVTKEKEKLGRWIIDKVKTKKYPSRELLHNQILKLVESYD